MPVWFFKSSVAKSPQDSSAFYPLTGITRFQQRLQQTDAVKKTNHDKLTVQDQLTVEEPLAIILKSPKQKSFTLAVTMRTPGHDSELVAGFLFAEGIIKNKKDILSIEQDAESKQPQNTLVVTLNKELGFEPDRLERHFFTHSGCGVCGKTSLQALEMLHQPELLENKPLVNPSTLYQLPKILREHQQQFSETGSTHSAALFAPQGELLSLKEDVGRHNALDKLIGSLLLAGKLEQVKTNLVLVSGRASFELVQKSLMADIPFLAAIGAPTSLAYQLADRHGMTLVGFLKTDSFNAYCGAERIR